jgi:hypothetical protein
MSGAKKQLIFDESGLADNAPSENQLVIHVLAPLAAIGATWAARKALDTGYRKIVGHNAPDPQDAQVKLGSALVWAAITAASAAVVEVAVFRILAKRG